ncbi:MAG: hypothetical protein WD646_13060 [Actinomycetota bacterium]
MRATEPGLLHRLRRDARSYAANVLPARVVPFCIVTNGRSGSSLLVDLLDSQPRIWCDEELFSVWRDMPRLYVRGRLHGARYRGYQAYGFKLNTLGLAEQFLSTSPKGGPVRLLRHLAADGFAFIHLRRRNLLRQAISALRAEEGRFHYRTSDEIPTKRLEIDVPTVLGLMTRFEVHDAGLATIYEAVPHATFWYEDDLADPERQHATVEAVCKLLGLPVHPSSTELRKVGGSPLEQEVANFDELTASVRITRFARFLDD